MEARCEDCMLLCRADVEEKQASEGHAARRSLGTKSRVRVLFLTALAKKRQLCLLAFILAASLLLAKVGHHLRSFLCLSWTHHSMVAFELFKRGSASAVPQSLLI